VFALSCVTTTANYVIAFQLETSRKKRSRNTPLLLAMAPVYLCSRLLPGQNAPLHFQMKNLEHLAPAALSQVAAVGVPHEREVSYTAYRENIDAFVAATIKKEKVFCSAEAFGRFKEDKMLPFPNPRIAFSPQKDFSETQEKKMMQNMGTEAEKKKAGKITHYVFQAGLDKLPFLHLLEPEKKKGKEPTVSAAFDDLIGDFLGDGW